MMKRKMMKPLLAVLLLLLLTLSAACTPADDMAVVEAVTGLDYGGGVEMPECLSECSRES